jgi:DNA-directed RNA polymerase subunit RPC12/RpoP
MQLCPQCGRRMHRKHRTSLEVLFATAVFRCSACGRTVKILRAIPGFDSSFVLSRYTRCANCGSARVRRLSRRRGLPLVTRHLVSQVLRLTGAPAYECSACHHQYFDWRPPHKTPTNSRPQVASNLYNHGPSR